MKTQIQQKKKILAILIIAISLFCLFAIGPAQRLSAITCPDGSYLPDAQAAECPAAAVGSDNETTRGELGGDECKTETDPLTGATESLSAENCGIIRLAVIGINLLSALAGMAIVFSIIFAGYQYMTARDNPGQVQKAKQRILMALVALALFIFMYAILDFLVPGGVFMS